MEDVHQILGEDFGKAAKEASFDQFQHEYTRFMYAKGDIDHKDGVSFPESLTSKCIPNKENTLILPYCWVRSVNGLHCIVPSVEVTIKP